MSQLRTACSLLPFATALLLPGIAAAQTAPADPPSGGGSLVKLDPFTVTSQEEHGYMSANAAGATRTQTPIFDTPQTINVMTSRFMEDIQAFTPQDAVRYLGNIQPRVNTQGGWRIRGNFVAQAFLNGFPTTTDLVGDSANIERVEIIKGSDAVALGQVDPDGSVNRVTKPPLYDKSLHRVDLTLGSFQFKRSAIDFGGPLGTSGRFGYRLNASYTGGGVFQHHDGPGGEDIYNETILIAPTFGWKINDTTTAHVDVQWDKERDYQPIFTVIGTDPNGNAIFIIPPERSPNYNGSYTHPEALNLQAYVVKQFGPNWTYRQAFAASDFRRRAMFSVNIGARLNWRRDHNSDWEVEGDLVGAFKLANVQNHFLFGYNFQSTDGYALLKRKNLKAINYLNPDYTAGYPSPDSLPVQSSVDSTSTDLSMFAEDQAAFFNDHVKVIGGFRFERLIAGSFNKGLEQPGTSDNVVAPRVGVAYQPTRNFSLYGLYSSGQRPQRATRPDGSVIADPIEGDTYEVGVKSILLNGRADMTFSYYNVVRKNLVNGVTINGVDTIEPSGEQKAKGFEFAASGSLNDDWDFVFNVATADTSDNSSFLNHPGSALGGATDLKVALWTTYRLTRFAPGWEIGGGWIYQSKMHGEDAEYTLPASNVFEARLAYARPRWKLALNVQNLTNERWFTDAPSFKLALPGAPRTVRVTYTYNW